VFLKRDFMKNHDKTFNRRRAAADFPGAEVILRQLKEKPTKRRVGFLSQGAPARGHTDILHPETRGEEPVGQVTLSFYAFETPLRVFQLTASRASIYKLS
jgi:glycine cleavage system aminomethyltransferase T